MTRRARTISPDDVVSPKTKREFIQAVEEVGGHDYNPLLRHSFREAEQMLQDLQYLLSRGDGWMRWTADRDGKVIYLKYKFTSLQHPNHYVFVSGPIYDVALWVAALVRKCEKVDAGELVPTLDKPFSHM